ncbi:MAG: hypothetical protein IKB85_04720 [Bacteroidales bacterium]|nr:hypothetical protein [Bacteroidales bacterium]
MGNREQQILDEIKLMVASLKRQLEMLEMKMSQLQDMDVALMELSENQNDETEGEAHEDVHEDVHDDVVMEVSFDIMDMDIAPEPESEPESLQEPDELPEPEEIPEPDDLPEPEVLPEPIPEVEASPIPDDLPEADPLPAFFASSVPVEPEAELPAPAPMNHVPSEIIETPVKDQAPMAVIDAMAEKQAWRTDMPGTPVRDIRSAISLNDRILFINYLFSEDPIAFQETLTSLNSMPSFDEAVNYLVVKHPEWDLESDTVYRFMMALRRRLQ